jgi:hypothetical protein
MADIDSQGYELQEIDLERHGPPARRPTWLWKQPIDVSTAAQILEAILADLGFCHRAVTVVNQDPSPRDQGSKIEPGRD